MSGMWCTAQAAHKLASYGIISYSDGAINNDVFNALKEAPALPISDSEGS